MKKTILAMFAAAALLLGMTGCENDDNPTSAMEQSLVGMWWDQFEYSDVTEYGDPFTSVLVAVQVDADHTGCIYLGVFDGTDEEPLEIYGGPEDAGFTWQLLDNGNVLVKDSSTGESAVLARTRGDSGGNYGDNVTNVSNTNMNYSRGAVTMKNDGYDGTLVKANADKKAEIEQTFRQKIKSNVGLGSGGKAPGGFGEKDIR
jgi:hypothetical protein